MYLNILLFSQDWSLDQTCFFSVNFKYVCTYGLKFNLTKKYLRYNLDIFFSHLSTFHKDSVASIYGLGVFN